MSANPPHQLCAHGEGEGWVPDVTRQTVLLSPSLQAKYTLFLLISSLLCTQSLWTKLTGLHFFLVSRWVGRGRTPQETRVLPGLAPPCGAVSASGHSAVGRSPAPTKPPSYLFLLRALLSGSHTPRSGRILLRSLVIHGVSSPIWLPLALLTPLKMAPSLNSLHPSPECSTCFLYRP